MADVFMSGLAAGLIILAALLLLTNVSWHGVGFASSGSWFASRGPQPEMITADLGASFLVGDVTTETVDEIDLGRFDISGISVDSPVAGGVVQSGVLFGEQKLRYSVIDPELLRFSIIRSNDYGFLIIKANGETIFEQDVGLGDFYVPIGIRGPVDIEISVSSSGWKMWAPSLYEISNVVVRSSHPTISYNFAIGEEFNRGEIVLFNENYQGVVDVKLNGKTIWSGVAPYSGVITASFYDVEDQNTLTVRARDGSYFRGTSVLRLVHRHIETNVYETTFNLTSAQIDKLPGHVVFEVPNVQRYGTIVVKLMAGNQTKLAESFDATAETHAVAVYKSNIVPRELTKLIIEGGDNALFSIRNLKIWV